MKALTWLEARSASQAPGRFPEGCAALGGIARGFLADSGLPGWLHDALVFRSVSPVGAGRLIGQPGFGLGHARQQLLIGGGRTVAEGDDQRIHA